jgi:hypothetical protein
MRIFESKLTPRSEEFRVNAAVLEMVVADLKKSRRSRKARPSRVAHQAFAA